MDTPGLSLIFLAAFPIVLAAFALGRTAALVAGALSAVLLFTDGLVAARFDPLAQRQAA